MEPIDRLKQLCAEGMRSKKVGLEHIDRLKDELREVIAQSDAEYFLDLFDKKIKYPHNQNNLLIPYLLGIVGDIDLSKPPESILGEFPDIDCDFIAPVRDYLKNEWAPKTFGEKYVSSIATYGTFKLASTLKDLARLYGNDHNEINLITKKFEATDDEGDPLTFEKALELYSDLNAYCETYPRIKEATTRLLRRSRSSGTHAGGLIISSVPIEDYIPIVRGKEGFPAAAWTEGLNTQDLGPMGFIKYDLLSIADLMRLAYICKLVKQRYGMSTICAIEGSEDDWSDISYLNDPDSLAMADRGDTLGIFQFDSFGIRRMMKEMTITSFDDLIAANAIYRPGPLGVGMDKTYAKRKKGMEEYEIHPILNPYLSNTYGVMVFQEQVMQILHIVGKIPLKDCEAIRKAISKKKIDKFIKYKEIFIKNGQTVLGQSEEELELLFSYVEKFSEYGFNKSIDIYEYVLTASGVKMIKDFVPGDVVCAIDEHGNAVETEVVAIHDHGILPGFEVTLDDGYKVVCSINHKFLTASGQMPLWRIVSLNEAILCDAERSASGFSGVAVDFGVEGLAEQSVLRGIQLGVLMEDLLGNEKWGHAPIAKMEGLRPKRIRKIVPVGERRMYDLEVACPTHNFILPNGVVTSNSHSTAYAYLAAQLLYLKSHYPLEFYAGTLTSEDDVDKIQEYRLDAKSFGRNIEVLPIDLNKSKDEFVIDGDCIYYSFNDLKGIGKETARRIAQYQPYEDLPDFMARCSANKDVCTRLIRIGCFGPDVEGNLAYYEKFSKAEKSKKSKVSGFRKSLDNWLNKIFSELKEKEIVEDSEREVLLDHFDEYGGCFEGKGADKKYQQYVKALKKRIDGHEDMLSDDLFPEYCPKDAGELTLAERAKIFSGAEMEYYGFRWIHPVKLAIERAPGRSQIATFKGFEASGKKELGVDCLVKGVSERTIKNSTRKMYKVKVEDANCSEYVVTIWGDDWERFEGFFEIYKEGKDSYGNILHMILQSDPIYGYNLKSYKWNERYKKPKDPADDLRVALLASGEDWSKW